MSSGPSSAETPPNASASNLAGGSASRRILSRSKQSSPSVVPGSSSLVASEADDSLKNKTRNMSPDLSVGVDSEIKSPSSKIAKTDAVRKSAQSVLTKTTANTHTSASIVAPIEKLEIGNNIKLNAIKCFIFY